MSNIMKKRCNENEESAEQRKGPWTLEEDTLLTNYIAHNGEGRWNLLAKSSGNILFLLAYKKKKFFFCFFFPFSFQQNAIHLMCA